MVKKLVSRLALVPAVVMAGAGSAHAALDAAVSTGITTAQTDLLALLSALTSAGIAVFVGRVIYRYFKLR